MRYTLLVLLILFTSCSNYNPGRGPTNTVEFDRGLIPTEYGSRPATDLMYDGELLLPDDAHNLYLESEGEFDLSKLNPDDTSILWKNTPAKAYNSKDDMLEIDPKRVMEYEDMVPSRTGRFRYTVSQTNTDGLKKTYIIMSGKQVHNILLRKNLLRKLGYKVPPIKYLKKINLVFSSSIAKEVFFNDLSSATFGDPTRWIPKYEEHRTATDRMVNENFKENYGSFLDIEKKQLVNVGSGKCLSRKLKKVSKYLREGKCNKFLGTNWMVEKRDNNLVAIRSPISGKCLDLQNISKVSKARFIEHECHYQKNQLFKMEEKDGKFTLKVQHSGKCLQFRGGKILKDRVVQKTCKNIDAQKWTFKKMINNDGKLLEAETIEMQDVIAMPSQDIYYNLALGFLPDQVIRGRRILNSLLVPFSLVYVPESVNLFNWHAGRIINKQIKVEFDSAENFTTTFDDAKWITRRILKLKRKDWEQIVYNAHFPLEVQMVLTEKLIARRNHFKNLLRIEDKNVDFDPNVSYGNTLKKGKLLTENWPGYASRFSFGDPESPLSGSEIGHFIGSTLVSQAIGGVIEYVGSTWLNNNAMLEEALKNRQEELYLNQLTHFFETGEMGKIPVGVFAYPTFGGNIIISRNVVIGSYLGTDNKVQLADVLGFRIHAGVYARVEGIPATIPVSVSGNAQVSYSRTYTHLRPILSFKASFKYPYKNLIVPYLKRKQGHIFEQILNGKLKNLEAKKRQKAISDAMEVFKKELGVGESLLISDNLVVGGNVNLGASFAQVIKLTGGIGGNNLTLSRLHILRSDENTIQVYKDLGNVTSLILSFQFKPVVPVLNISLNISKGYAKTKFYKINIQADENKNPDIIKSMTALKGLFLQNSLEATEMIEKPYILKHKFRDVIGKIGITAFKFSGLSGKNEMEIIHPEGARKKFFQSTQITRRGLNFEDFAVEAINGVLGEYTEWDINFSGLSRGGSPGDTLGGSAFLFGSTYEGELMDPYREGIRKKGGIETPFGTISQSYRGWSITRTKAEKIINGWNEKYGMEFYPKQVLQQTKKIFLYELALNIFVYEGGLEHFAGLSLEQFEKIANKHTVGRVKKLKALKMINTFKLFEWHLAQKNYESYAKYMRKLLSHMDRWMDLEGFKKVLGGDQNFFIYSRIQGFRHEDEAGDTAILSNSIGQFGSAKTQGIMNDMMNRLGMTSSEFYGYWIRNRLF
ncbi:MAG: hypothetical protein DRQ88_06950 [Epsilonproteobacteria bacterium]|nr:MAG: hypothetical protein DRQ89_05640 [Campylobacterota bacterium]RLA66373.1 MAG: hypothetical protein DRQ88_06950 [Campylobacterota bacterium]